MQLHAGLHGEEWGVEQATTATGARAEEGEQGGEEGALEADASRVRRRLRYEEAAAPGVGLRHRHQLMEHNLLQLCTRCWASKIARCGWELRTHGT